MREVDYEKKHMVSGLVASAGASAFLTAAAVGFGMLAFSESLGIVGRICAAGIGFGVAFMALFFLAFAVSFALDLVRLARRRRRKPDPEDGHEE